MYNLISVDWVIATEGITHSKPKTKLGGKKGWNYFSHVNDKHSEKKKKCETTRFPCSESLKGSNYLPQRDSGASGAL